MFQVKKKNLINQYILRLPFTDASTFEVSKINMTYLWLKFCEEVFIPTSWNLSIICRIKLILHFLKQVVKSRDSHYG